MIRRQQHHPEGRIVRYIGLLCRVLCAAMMLLSGACIGMAGVNPLAVVSGSFLYARAETAGNAAKISYQVEALSFKGSDAWRISWSDAGMDAEHYIRRSDGAPLFVRRVSHAKQTTVEIEYSTDPAKPHIYRRKSSDELLVRRIRQSGLIDMGTLPQVLSGLQAARDSGELHFSAINYSDGQVYALVSRRTGFARVNAVDCAIYETNLDSWKAAFNSAVRLQVPVRAGLANFSTYSGPDPSGSGKMISMHMLSRSPDVASLTLAHAQNQQ